jgi:hypothetical protein
MAQDDGSAEPTLPGPGDGPPRSVRVDGLAALAATPERRELRRLAAAMRATTTALVSTTASPEELAAAATQLESIAASLSSLPAGHQYEGFSEAANAGAALRAMAELRDEDDPERFGFFDELLGATQSLSGTQGMTAHLDVDYRSPTPLGEELLLHGWLSETEGRKIWAQATLHVGDRLCAEARALFLAFRPGAFEQLLEARDG